MHGVFEAMLKENNRLKELNEALKKQNDALKEQSTALKELVETLDKGYNGLRETVKLWQTPGPD